MSTRVEHGPHNEKSGIARTREKLREKLVGEPDFILDNEYCGEGAFPVEGEPCVKMVAHTKFPTRYGEFVLFGFFDSRNAKEHTAIVKGDVKGAIDCPVRVHSQCHTGDVWGSLRCDCRDQLEASIRYISEQSIGAVVYLKQEGRGIGLLNKIKAYQLQDLGLDTVEANEFLGFPAEARDYSAAARIIEQLGIESVALLTNNPEKMTGLRAHGIEVTRRIPVQTNWNEHNNFYMETKREKMGHLF